MFRTSSVFRMLIGAAASALAFSAFLFAQSAPSRQATPSQTTTPIYTAPGPLLPEMFAGWQLSGTRQTSTDPQAADKATAGALKEYGFSRYEAASYARGSDMLSLKAVQFQDATGAYGAFTFYRRPNMAPEQIGQGAAFDGDKVLFWSGTVFMEATFSNVTATSAGELRDLCTLLPKPQGNQGTMPTLPDYLPRQHLKPETMQYAIGPDAYGASGGVLPASLVDFDMSAEAVTAQYDSLNGTGTLTIVNYPTPEIAANRQRAIAEYLKSHGAATDAKQAGVAAPVWTTVLANSYPEALQTRRSGPLVAVTSGEFTAGTAQQLLQRVNYEATLTLGNSGRYVPDTTKLAQLILGVAYLVGIFALIAIVAAISLGGGKIWWRKMRRKSGQEDDSAEFIRLNLRT
jgi:hypothetical protein